MGIKDALPDRPLKFDEFQSIQRQDTFDEVYTSDAPGDIDILILVQGDSENTLHYTDEKGWHVCNPESE